MTIDILIPALGDARLLERALASVAAQSLLPDGVLVVIDQPDHAAHLSVVKRFQERIPNLRALGNDENVGIQRSTVAGLVALSSEWVAFLDHDDELLPDAIRRVKVAIEASPYRLDAVFADWTLRMSGGLLPPKDYRAPVYRRDTLFFSPYDAMIARNFIPHLRVVRRSTLSLRRDRSLDGAQDWYWNMGLVRGGLCCDTEVPLYRHYVHPRQFTQLRGYVWLDGLNRVRRRLVSHAPAVFTPPPDTLALRLRGAMQFVLDNGVPLVAEMQPDQVRLTPFSPMALAETLRETPTAVDLVVLVTDRFVSLGPYVRSLSGEAVCRTALLVLGDAVEPEEMLLELGPYFDALHYEQQASPSGPVRIRGHLTLLSRWAKWLAPKATSRRRLAVRAGLLVKRELRRRAGRAVGVGYPQDHLSI